MDNLPTILVALIGFVGVWLTVFFNYRTARQTRRHQHLIAQMAILSEAYAEYEQYLAKHGYTTPDNLSEHGRIIGKAIAACLAAADQPKGREWLELPMRSVNGEGEKREYDIEETKKRTEEIAKEYESYLSYIALRRLTRNPVKKPKPGQVDPSFGPSQAWEVEHWGSYWERNRNALGDAMIRMAELIKKVQ